MKVTWVLASGQKIEAEVAAGETLKDAALAASVPGIKGDCGGFLSCATCHVIVAPEWASLVGPPGETEEDMLDLTEVARREGSRLSCQIAMSDDLDGIEMKVPE